MKRKITMVSFILLWISAVTFTSASETPDEAGDYLAGGIRCYEQSDYSEALTAFERALIDAREHGDQRGAADALYRIGMTCEKLEDYPKSRLSLEESLEIYRQIGDLWGMADCRFEIGYVYYYEKRHDEALPHFREMLDLFIEIGSEVGRGIALNNIGMVSIELDDYDGALSCYEDALSIFRNDDNDRLSINALRGIARIHGKRQEYENELSALSEALKIAERIGDRPEEAALLSDVGVDYAMLGQYDEAIVFQGQSLTLFRALGDKKGEGYALIHTGSALNNLGRYEEGLEKYKSAREVFREIGDSAGTGFANAGMAFSHHELGHTVRSFFLFSHVLGTAKREKVDIEIADDPLIRGMIAAGMERYRKAVPELENALTEGIAHNDIIKIGYSAGYLGYCCKALGEYEKAVDYYGAAIDVLERVRGDIRQDTHKTSFMKSKIEVYEDIIEILIKLERLEEAFDYMERARSRALLDLLGNGRFEVKGARERELLKQEDDIAQRLSRLVEPPGTAPEVAAGRRSDADSRLRALDEAAEEYGDLIRKIKSENPELASLVAVNSLSLAQVRAIMTDEARIIEYFTTRDATYIFSVGKRDLSVYTVPITREELSSKVSALREGIRSTIGSDNVTGAIDTARGLYDILMAPVVPAEDETRLIIIPHGPLHYLPFAALFDGRRFLIERYTLVIDPSASVLKYIIEKRKRPDGAVVAFGNPTTKYNPLPFAEHEVADIGSIMEKADIYLGDRATETRGKKSFAKYSIIHLACHGMFNPTDPLSSALFLSPDGLNDGMLKVNELFGLYLPGTSLVVLSACETGLSHVMKGDELIGLSRGFIFSGTPSLVVTLWEVADDSTAALMRQFYRNLKEGMDKPESLRQSMLWLRSQPEYEHPFYWAPFVMIGDWR
ncbi:MAG: CHAT domain-containing protein [Deltaproteobacteria bacterium]|nr:CHAT domain-containing protein [Candidatus Zymogenaceae bacterium]